MQSEPKSRGLQKALATLAALALLAGAYWVSTTAKRRLHGCCRNILKLGDAFELYSVDNEGRYPKSIEALVPKYLEALPACPAAGTTTYELSTTIENDQNYEDYYWIFCKGHHHSAAEVPVDHPAQKCTERGIMGDRPGSSTSFVRGCGKM